MPSVSEQLAIIQKGVQTLVSTEELQKKLETSVRDGRPLTIKLGLDPSAPDIHLGHAVVLRKIKQMQDLGHRAVIVIGDFTGRIGDPTGKSKGRAALTSEQVRANAQTYYDQILQILQPDKTEIRFNSQWLAGLPFEKVLSLAASTTVARLLERDDFQARYQSNTPIGLHEFFYPLMQAYDSVQLKADIEVGGTDQTFNILMGRTLQKSFGQAPQIALFMPILEGLDGKEKMSKSLHNYIGIHESAEVMFKKVMEVPDALILRYYELATDEHPDTIATIRAELESGQNPRDSKYRLAQIITGLYHTPADAARAKEYYDTAFGAKAIPQKLPILILEKPGVTLLELFPALIAAGYASSTSALRRLAAQGGVQVNQEKVIDIGMPLHPADVLKLGKKTLIRLAVSKTPLL